MNNTYFLAANSAKGFYSVYSSFPPGKNDFLHIIKGGPGSGKSGFMRRIGRAAEDEGFDVHYVLCSGDPDSLDAVYIPALHSAWIDGTNPHVREPELYAVNSDYVNFGDFLKDSLSKAEKDYVNFYFHAYKSQYSAAYGFLSAALNVRNSAETNKNNSVNAKTAKYLHDIIIARPAEILHFRSLPPCCFLSCISCKGKLQLDSEIFRLCKCIYVIQSELDSDYIILDYLKNYARFLNEYTILCPSPLEPEKLSAVLFPRRGLIFTDKSWKLKNSAFIDADSLLELTPDSDSIEFKNKCTSIEKELLSLAYEKLAQAKKYHDELELQYRPHIDFAALNEFTQQQIDKLLK